MFDVKRFIKREFSSPVGLFEALLAAGFAPPEPASISKWVLRNSMPGKYLAASLLVLELQQGSPASVSAYMTKRISKCSTSSKKKPTCIGAQQSVFD